MNDEHNHNNFLWNHAVKTDRIHKNDKNIYETLFDKKNR